MANELLLKIGYYSIYQNKTNRGIKYIVDSGKTIKYVKDLLLFRGAKVLK